MQHPGFFERAQAVRLGVLAEKVGSRLGPGCDPDLLIHDVKPLAEASAGHVTFVDNRKYLPQLAAARASACLGAPAFAERVPNPRRPWSWTRLSRFAWRAALLSSAMVSNFAATLRRALVQPSARLEEDGGDEPGAVVGSEAQIGRGT